MTAFPRIVVLLIVVSTPVAAKAPALASSHHAVHHAMVAATWEDDTVGGADTGPDGTSSSHWNELAPTTGWSAVGHIRRIHAAQHSIQTATPTVYAHSAEWTASHPALGLPVITAYADSAERGGYRPPDNDNDFSGNGCEYWLAQVEARYSIPPHLLHAIALTESGRRQSNGQAQPDPLAMNIGGRSWFAHSTSEMQAIAGRYAASRNIDVGCMQISLKNHARNFADWRMLLIPRVNVEYSARFLNNLAVQLGSWEKAAAAYHSRRPTEGAHYLCSVSRSYGHIYGAARRANGCGPALAPMMVLASGGTVTAPAGPRYVTASAVVQQSSPQLQPVVYTGLRPSALAVGFGG